MLEELDVQGVPQTSEIGIPIGRREQRTGTFELAAPQPMQHHSHPHEDGPGDWLNSNFIELSDYLEPAQGIRKIM